MGNIVREKLDFALQWNVGWKTIKAINQVISGSNEAMNEIKVNLTPGDLTALKFARVTTTGVERSFSQYKSMLADKSKSFKFEKFRQVLFS